jgi:hypothetical protein
MSEISQPLGASAPEGTTCDYVVESVNTESRTAQVRFINPYYSGKFIVEEKEPLPTGLDEEGGAEPKDTMRMVDKDPNPHLTKSVNVPFNETGPDLDAFANICAQQARGARNRMEAAYARNLASSAAAIDLSGLVGLTNKTPQPAPSAQ